MSNRVQPRSESVRVRAHSRSGLKGAIRVSAHDRSAPNGREGGADAPDQAGTDAERGYLHLVNDVKAQQKMQHYLTFFRQNAAHDKEGVDNG